MDLNMFLLHTVYEWTIVLSTHSSSSLLTFIDSFNFS